MCIETKHVFLSDRQSSMRINFPKSMMTLYLLATFTSSLNSFLFLIKAMAGIAARLTAWKFCGVLCSGVCKVAIMFFRVFAGR